MFILKLLRLITGYVYFRADGGFGERFINLCALRKIVIRDVKMDENGLLAVTAAVNYKKLHSTARASGMKLSAIKKSGLPFFLRKNKNRVGLLIGGVFFVLFMSVTSMFIWSVETMGSQKMSSELVAEQLSDIGLSIGQLKSKTDPYELTRRAMIKLSGKVSWLAVNINGTRAVVEARDYEERREDETYREPCNIVADFDGLILSIEVHNGKKAVNEGSGIDKGDLLISGIVENRDTSSQFMEARGTITALHSDTLSVKQSKSIKANKYKRSKIIYKLYFLGISVPLGFFDKTNDAYDEYEKSSFLEYNGVKLPFAVKKCTRAYYENQKAQLQNCEVFAFDEYTMEFYEKYKNTLVLKSDAAISDKNNSISILSENSCIDFMGVKQKISFE